MPKLSYTIEQLREAVKQSNTLNKTVTVLCALAGNKTINERTIIKKIKEHNIDTSHWRKHRVSYTIEQLKEAVSKSLSLNDCAKKLGFMVGVGMPGSNGIKNRIKEHNINVSHWIKYKNENRVTFTADQLRKAVNESLSLSECRNKLKDMTGKSGGCDAIRNKIKEYNINASHWLERKMLLRERTGRTTQAYLDNKFPITSSELKEKLLEEGFLEEKCYKCEVGNIWQGEHLTLQLHHVDGNRDNNNLDNLQILCPNCHAQTDNYGFKNRNGANHKRKEYRKKYREEKKNGRN